MSEPVIAIRDLRIGFTARAGHTQEVLKGVNVAIRPGETLGIVGESGSGKSTVALASMGYMKPGLRRLSGDVRFEGKDMFAQTLQGLEAIRGGDAAYNAAALTRLLEGENGAYRDAVIFNAAATLMVAGRCSNWNDGAALAAEAIDSLAAKNLLAKWIELTV